MNAEGSQSTLTSKRPDPACLAASLGCARRILGYYGRTFNSMKARDPEKFARARTDEPYQNFGL